MPNHIGNLCIVGHNYKNTLMFSKLDILDKDDSIFVSDLNKNRKEYIIYDKYNINENDLTCTNNSKSVEITLVTCNKNNNRKRIIIKAKMKES